jgi:hypothetical protein
MGNNKPKEKGNESSRAAITREPGDKAVKEKRDLATNKIISWHEV